MAASIASTVRRKLKISNEKLGRDAQKRTVWKQACYSMRKAEQLPHIENMGKKQIDEQKCHVNTNLLIGNSKPTNTSVWVNGTNKKRKKSHRSPNKSPLAFSNEFPVLVS